MASPNSSKPQIIPPPANVSNPNSHQQRIKDEPDLIEEKKPPTLRNMNNKAKAEVERAERFKKYEAEYTEYLKNKYFSDKDIYGGNIFEKTTVVDGKIIKEGRFPGTLSYADPAAFKALTSSSGARPDSEGARPDSEVRPPANTSNQNRSAK